MARRNPLDRVLDGVEQELERMAKRLDALTEGDAPFDSRRLTPEESVLLYQHPAGHPAVADERDPATGMTLTDEQAAMALFQKWGPQTYTDWVEENERYLARRPVTLTPLDEEEMPL